MMMSLPKDTSVIYQVSFAPPTVQESSYLWDNFQDALYLFYQDRQTPPIQISIFAYKSSNGGSSIYPAVIQQPNVPSKRMFQLAIGEEATTLWKAPSEHPSSSKQNSPPSSPAVKEVPITEVNNKVDALNIVRRLRARRSKNAQHSTPETIHSLNELITTTKNAPSNQSENEFDFYQRIIKSTKPKPPTAAPTLQTTKSRKLHTKPAAIISPSAKSMALDGSSDSDDCTIPGFSNRMNEDSGLALSDDEIFLK